LPFVFSLLPFTTVARPYEILTRFPLLLPSQRKEAMLKAF